MVELVVLEEIRTLLFPLREEELKLLEESVRKEGIRDPLVVWKKDGQLILLDGFHRYQLAKKYNLRFEIKELNFQSADEAKLWVIANQLGRRNLTDEQRTYAIGKYYELLKKEPHRPKKEKNSDKLSEFSGETAKTIESLAKVDTRTVYRASEFATAVEKIKEIDPQVAEKILSGEIKDAKTELPKLVKEKPHLLPEVAKKIKEGKKKIKEAEKEVRIEKELKKANSIKVPPEIDLRLGDFREVLKDVKNVDAIITDPPYGKNYLQLWDDIGKFAKEKLKEHGYLVAYSGKMFLPQVLDILSKHLSYYWTFCLLLPGGTSIIDKINVMDAWKPVLIFSKGKTKLLKTVRDVVENETREKDLHEWQQGLPGMKKFVEIFTEPGDTVCDPMFGSGTTALACKELKRKFVGAEIDKEAFNLAKVRLG
jgi:16S rRNA G966 N2-methylase RsmD